MTKIEYSHEERRKILLENKYLYTEDHVCEKWSISKYQLRIWKKEFNYSYFTGSLHDTAVVALNNGSHTIPAIINHLDMLNHARYTEDEVLELLEGLKSEGIAKEKDGKWFYNMSHSKNGTSFIF